MKKSITLLLTLVLFAIVAITQQWVMYFRCEELKRQVCELSAPTPPSAGAIAHLAASFVSDHPATAASLMSVAIAYETHDEVRLHNIAHQYVLMRERELDTPTNPTTKTP